MYFFETDEQWMDCPFLISDQNEMITYRGKDKFCESMGSVIRERSLVFILCRNCIGSILGYFACLKKRAIPLLLDAKMDYDMIKNLIDTYEPDYLYYPGEQEELWKTYGEVTGFEDYGYCLRKFKSKRNTTCYPELALLLTTSGSTGNPKLVRQSYQNIQSNAVSIAQYLELNRGERPITTLPMNYTYGLSIINSHALCGAAILVTEHGMFETEFWDFFKAQEATSFGGVPFTYEMLKRLHFFEMDLPSLRTMTQAGGKLPKYLQREFANFAIQTGRKFIVMYGQTEATARMTYLPAEDAIRKEGSIGIAIPGGVIEIRDGELVYQGKNVTLGYAQKKEDLEKGDERHGILETGDMARKDEEGFFYIVGRKKRFLKILGKRVNLDDVEQILKSKYRDITLACTGTDDQMHIYVEKYISVNTDEIKEYLSEKTGLNPAVFRIMLVGHIPVNESGKVLYGELEEGKCHIS